MKKILALALALVLAFALAIPAFAIDVAQNGTETEGNPTFPDQTAPDTEVIYQMAGYYTVTIPTTFSFTNTSASAAQNVTVSDAMLGYKQGVKISASYDGTLKLKEAPTLTQAYLKYELTVADSTDPLTDDESAHEVTTITAPSVEAGYKDFVAVSKSITAALAADQEAIYAGVYTATVTFTVEVVDVA